MDTQTAAVVRRYPASRLLLLLLPWAARPVLSLGDQCTVAHYLAAGEVRPFSFRSGDQFVADLRCVFSFSAPADELLALELSDLDLAPPTGSGRNSSCVDDVLTVYDLADGELQPVDSYCGNNSSSSQPIMMSSNIAVVVFVSHEKMTTRSFTITISAVQGEQTDTTTQETENVTEDGQTGGRDQNGEGNGEEEEEEDDYTDEEEGEEDDTEDDGDQGDGKNTQKTAGRKSRQVSYRSSNHQSQNPWS